MKKHDFSHRFGFIVNEVGRLYGRQFDQLSREELGLSRAQCRLLGQVATSDGGQAPTQAELAQHLDLTPMAVATLVDRLEIGGLDHAPSQRDRPARQRDRAAAARRGGAGESDGGQ